MFSEKLYTCTEEFSKARDEEYFGEDSRCFNSNFRPMCFQTQCSAELNAILVKLGEEVFRCEFDGQKINASFIDEDTYIECPPFRTVCPE